MNEGHYLQWAYGGIYDFWAASQLRNVKVEKKNYYFLAILGLGVPGSQRSAFSGSRNARLFLNFSKMGRTTSPRATKAPKDVGKKPLRTKLKA